MIPNSRHQQRGVALIIVLAFVVLLTVVVLAFFSRSMDERQLSDSSVSSNNADAFARSATDIIIGDLKQEIADPVASTSFPVGSGSSQTTLYIPKTAANMLPVRSGNPAIVGGVDPIPNLVRRSVRSDAIAAPGVGSRASSLSSSPASASTVAKRGEISFARWNAHYLIPRFDKGQNVFDSTPDTSANFVPPDWVFVTDKGPEVITSPSKNVVGRYAYAIYDEGGLLDTNAAGFPADPTAGGTNGLSLTQIGQKNSLALADLTQLPVVKTPGGSQSDYLQQQQINNFVAWRNYASAQLTGSSGAFKSASFDPTTAKNWLNNFVVGNSSGYLKTFWDTSGSPARTDQAVLSRQQLIDLWRSLDISPNALQYLGTFSRALNQPSYFPIQSVDPSKPGYNNKAPKILAANAGGNNGTGLDAKINPSFLTVPVQTAFPRNDGSTAVPGEPLAKQRFALSRLAWLTCKGPSAPRAGSSDPDIAAMKADGISQAWLEQGTDANIEKYFGLRWDSSKHEWTYDVHNGGAGAIMKLGDIASSGSPHDPDFFELLKAAIKAGSIAKVGTSIPGGGNYPIQSLINQYQADSRIDNAIIQIGANIIDQYDTDSFPTRILFNDGGGANAVEFRGIENLPYLYRVHPAVVKVVAPSFANTASNVAYGTRGISGKDILTVNTSPVTPGGSGSNDYYNTTSLPAIKDKVQDTGLGATVLIPELWNPHDWSDTTPTQLDQTMGTMGPTGAGAFEIYAESSAPVIVRVGNSWNADLSRSISANPSTSPGYTSKGFSFAGTQWGPLNEANSKMIFTVPKSAVGAQLFREPTVLYRAGHPQGSNLSAPGLASAPGAVTSGSQLRPAIAGQNGSGTTLGPPLVGRSYIGMYIGTIPLVWRIDSDPSGGEIWRSKFAVLQNGVDFTFKLQCQDAYGTMVTYDEKQVTIGTKGISFGIISAPMTTAWAGLLQPSNKGDRQYFVLDPRTSRFGFQTSSIDQEDWDTYQRPAWSFPPFSSEHLQKNSAAGITPVEESWLSRDEGIMGSIRNGWGIGAPLQAIAPSNWLNAGVTPYNFPSSMGFYPGNPGNNSKWTWDDANNACYPGLFADNTAAGVWNNNVARDVEFYYGRPTSILPTTSEYYTDADGVARRGMGGWSDVSTTWIGPPNYTAFNDDFARLMGLPMRVAHEMSGNQLRKIPVTPAAPASLLQAEARPMILNRPFRSVGELGYTFSGTPWKNLNFNMPESGDAALLDVFCINDTDDSRALVAGKVDLNTRQVPVLRAIIAGAYKDESPATPGSSSAFASSTLADLEAKRLVARTTGFVPSGVVVSGTGARPLQNVSDLVGKWVSGKAPGLAPTGTASAPPYGPTSFDGFSADLFNPSYFLNGSNKTPNTDASDDPANPSAIVLDKAIGRLRAAPIRALASAGQTRVWNLMIDVVAQTGRFAPNATNLSQFLVEGEQRYWVHVAIDRLTGNVIDKQIEVVKE